MHMQSHGFVGAKISCAYGPSEGDSGLAKNVELFRQARESVGPDFPLMCVIITTATLLLAGLSTCTAFYEFTHNHLKYVGMGDLLGDRIIT